MSPEPSPHTRDASTVLLLRDGTGGVEVFMEKRHIKSDFVGGAYVFPGGRVDPEDGLDDELCTGITDAQASSVLGLEQGGLAYWAAAVRECFEEAGVLLAYDRDGELLDFRAPELDQRYRELRDGLNSGELTLEDIVRREELKLATDRIHYWSHWITPEGQPRRYDTRFFVAEAPPNQTAAHDDWELTSSDWVTPAEAIDKALKREWMIIFPTMKNLMQLGEYSNAHAALEGARAQGPLAAMVPRVLETGGEARVVLPGDEGYEGAVRDVSGFDPRIFWRSLQT